ncbi:MAG: hypothetical protein OXN89_15715 [Bryobacterales bacterium]|nr:hypothetical protein [Bryobacterales bacterium]
MPTSTPPADADSLAVLHALTRKDLSPEDAYNAMEGLRNMAAANLIARFESKLEAQNTQLETKLETQNTKLDAQNSQLASLRWMMGVGFTLLALLVTLLRLLG